jgi:MerR family transcriptional regulator/heat shock protein HspR
MYKKIDPSLIEDINEAVLTIGQIAELSNLHPQTIRSYDKLGLLTASRSKGKSRRYSLNDVQKLTEIQIMSNEEGINLNGIRRILSLEEQNRMLKRQLLTLQHNMIFKVDSNGDTLLGTKSPVRKKGIKGLLTSS